MRLVFAILWLLPTAAQALAAPSAEGAGRPPTTLRIINRSGLVLERFTLYLGAASPLVLEPRLRPGGTTGLRLPAGRGCAANFTFQLRDWPLGSGTVDVCAGREVVIRRE